MDEQQVALMAVAAGLNTALEQFRDDVLVAAREAFENAATIDAPTDPRVEPWPAMRVAVQAGA